MYAFSVIIFICFQLALVLSDNVLIKGESKTLHGDGDNVYIWSQSIPFHTNGITSLVSGENITVRVEIIRVDYSKKIDFPISILAYCQQKAKVVTIEKDMTSEMWYNTTLPFHHTIKQYSYQFNYTVPHLKLLMENVKTCQLTAHAPVRYYLSNGTLSEYAQFMSYEIDTLKFMISNNMEKYDNMEKIVKSHVEQNQLYYQAAILVCCMMIIYIMSTTKAKVE
jgi:hypothetical protein